MDEEKLAMELLRALAGRQEENRAGEFLQARGAGGAAAPVEGGEGLTPEEMEALEAQLATEEE